MVNALGWLVYQVREQVVDELQLCCIRRREKAMINRERAAAVLRGCGSASTLHPRIILLCICAKAELSRQKNCAARDNNQCAISCSPTVPSPR
jgi:hypothetical protein